MPNKLGWTAIGILVVAALLGCAWTGWWMGRRAFRVEAIQAGHARRVIIDDFGNTAFEWLQKGDK